MYTEVHDPGRLVNHCFTTCSDRTGRTSRVLLSHSRVVSVRQYWTRMGDEREETVHGSRLVSQGFVATRHRLSNSH